MQKLISIIIAAAVAVGIFFYFQSQQNSPVQEQAQQSSADVSGSATASAPSPAISAEDVTEYIEGQHYDVMSEPQAVSTGDNIEVLELFWYGCGHCNDLEAPLHDWLQNGKAENAEYVAFPAVFSARWEVGARAYYTFEALEITDTYHGKLFNALHEQGKHIDNAQQLAAWVESEGGDGQAILDTYESFAVNNKIEHAKNMTKQYAIEGVPAVIVDGRYRTSVTQAGNHANLFKVINFLVTKAAMERS